MKDHFELSKFDILQDPMICQVMTADGVSVAELRALIENVSARLEADCSHAQAFHALDSAQRNVETD